jgi:peroxiredoxin
MPDRRSALAVLGVFALAAPAIRAANIPRKAPDFAVSLSNGQQVTLAQYKGKVVALAFILTSCPDCQRTVRVLIQSQNEFGPRGFQALASAIEETARINVPEFVRQFNPPFPVGYNQQRPVLDFMQHPPMVDPIMPLLVFIDREGVIRAQYEGHEPFLAADQVAKNVRAKILELLNEGAPPAKSAPRKPLPNKKTKTGNAS